MRTTLALSLLCALASFAAAHFNAAGPGAHSSAVDWWLWQTEESVKAISTPGPYGARLYAEVAVSQYLAISTNAAAGAPHNPRDLATFAAYQVLSATFPSRQATVYDRAVRNQFNTAITDGSFTSTSYAGAQAAAASAVAVVLAGRNADGVADFAYKAVPSADAVGLTPGQYRLTPAAPGQPAQTSWFAPQLGSALSFSLPALDGHDLFHSLDASLGGLAPLPVGSPAYAAGVEYVRVVGGNANLTSTNRTADQSATAMFWMQGMGTSGPAGQWLTAAAGRIGADATELERAELYARMATSMFDAMTVTYYLKYASGHGKSPFWRPITAIRTGSAAAGPPADAGAGADSAGAAGAGDAAPAAAHYAPRAPEAAQASSGGEHGWPHWGLREGLAFVNELAGKHGDDRNGGAAAAEPHDHGRRRLRQVSTSPIPSPFPPLSDGGNGSVTADPSWYPAAPTPPHPEWPAGHPTMAAAAAYVLDRWFGGHPTGFVVWSDAPAGSGGGGGGGGHRRRLLSSSGLPLFPVGDANRTFADAATAAGDVALSRVYVGAHYPASTLDALTIGRTVADAAWDGFTANVVMPAAAPMAANYTPGSKAAIAAAARGVGAAKAALGEEVAGAVDGLVAAAKAHKEGL